MAADITSLSIKVSSEGIKEASQQLSGLSTTANNVEKRLAKLIETSSKLMNIQATATSTAKAYMDAMQGSGAGISGATGRTESLASATTHLSKAMLVLAESMKTVERHAKTSSSSIDLHTKSMAEAHAVARGLAGGMGALWLTYGNFTGMAIGVGIAASLKGIVTVGSEVENTLEGIRVRGGESVESVGKLRDVVTELGSGVYGPREVAKALHTLVLAGQTAEESVMSVRDALNLATVGEVPIEKAAETLVTVGTALGYSAASYSIIADVISKTAAASKSSVEGLSQSFKSASSVAQMYKLSIVDMGASLAALANLGVERSAGGTALKNFYKDLTSGSDKSTAALKRMGLTIDDLRDKEGKMDNMAVILGKMSEGLKGFTGGTQSDLLKDVFGERGIKMAQEGISLVRKEAEDGTNAFVQLGKTIQDSYGFAAMGGAQMALTTKSQMASVKNALEVAFTQTFKEIEPQIGVFSARLKEAFAGGEFKQGLKDVAVLFADMAVWVATHIDLLANLAKAFIALKFAMMIGETVAALATGFAALRTAMAGATLASTAFQASLGILGGLLAGAAALWTLFSDSKAKASTGAAAQQSLQYLTDYAKGLDAEAERLRTQISLIRSGTDARDAHTEAMRRETVEMARTKLSVGLASAKASAEAATAGASPYELSKAEELAASGRRTGFAVYDNMANAIAKSRHQSVALNAEFKKTEEGVANVRKLSLELETAAEAARAKRAFKSGSGTIVSEHKKTAGERAAASLAKKELSAFEALLKNAKDKLLIEEGQADSTHKLTDAEKELLRVREQLNKNALHASPAQQAALAIVEKGLTKQVEYNYAMRTYAAQQQEAYTASNKTIEAAVKEAEALEAKAKVVGLNKSETRASELAELEFALAQELSKGVTTRYTAELMALVDAKKRSAAAEAMIESKKHGRTGEEGALEALKKYGQAANDTGSMIENALTNAFKGAEDALVNFVKTGKLDFKSFADAVITDLIRMQIRMAMGQAAGGGSGGMGGIGSLANLFGGSAALTMNNAGMMMSEGISASSLLMAFADGGDPPVGVPSLVGERGPELFVPKQAGTIIPNHKLGGSSSSENTASGGEMKFTIVNQTTGRIDDVKEQRISDTERALIITEAVNATAASLYDSNSKVSKGMSRNFNSQRNR